MAHWRTMITSDNFSASDLWDEKAERFREITIQIVKVEKDEVTGEKGRKKTMPFVTMRDQRGSVHQKRFGCVATNCESISELAGSPDMKKWPGTWLTMYVTKTDVGNKKKDCIRIKPPPGDAGKSAAAPSSPTHGSGATQDEAASQVSPARDESTGEVIP